MLEAISVERERLVDPDEMLTVKDIMRLFHVSEETARRFYTDYGLEAKRLPGGREVRFTRAAVREFVNRLDKAS